MGAEKTRIELKLSNKQKNRVGMKERINLLKLKGVVWGRGGVEERRGKQQREKERKIH